MDGDHEQALAQQVRDAHRRAQPLCIVGGGSKHFYGRRVDNVGGESLTVTDHHGVLNYDPSELVVTARAGTRLADLEKLLADQNQMLGFEPPHFGDSNSDGDGNSDATIGGTVAAGLAGPRRPFAGAVRDFVLGVKLLTGRGEVLRFGGEVMKNVAGFDIARLTVGALGVLGALLEVSLRVLPKSPREKTLVLQHKNSADAIALFNRLARQPLPLSAAVWWDGETRIRLSASDAGVADAVTVIGGDVDADGATFWQQLRDHQLEHFQTASPLLRVSVPPSTTLLPPAGVAQLIDWGGAQHWLAGDTDVAALRAAVTEQRGHVVCFRGGNRDDVFQPLAPALQTLHTRLKTAFDPVGILNRGRLYAQW